jgi:hypothetical protein
LLLLLLLLLSQVRPQPTAGLLSLAARLESCQQPAARQRPQAQQVLLLVVLLWSSHHARLS